MRFDCFHRPSATPYHEPPPLVVIRCDMKHLFTDEEAAWREAFRLRKRATYPWRLEAYWCHRHHGWHVGNRGL